MKEFGSSVRNTCSLEFREELDEDKIEVDDRDLELEISGEGTTKGFPRIKSGIMSETGVKFHSDMDMHRDMDMGMNYCTNDTSLEFEEKILSEIIEPLRRFDKRTLDTKPAMAKARIRIVLGASETKKYLELGKVKAIIIARDLNDDILLGKERNKIA